ncbi:MAG: class I SAM-dependent methyltransferase [Planctomycetota bacterium]
MANNNRNKYQHDFSRMHPDSSLHDLTIRRHKAKKTISVLEDYLGDLKQLSALDIGCSKGLMTELYAEKFKKVSGIDVDEPAVEFAIENNSRTNVEFYVKDGMATGFEDESFDVVICTHVYEHVPDSRRLMSEIYRLLKVGGVCYFAAANRLMLIERHYRLPLLSVIPKCLGNIYLRLLKKGDFYYEKLLTLWGLRRLVSEFTVIDYAFKIVRDPEKFYATEMITPGSLRQKLALGFLKVAYWLSPSYVWLLQKSK